MPKIEIAGKTPINKYIYHSGKLSAWLSWLSILVQFSGFDLRMVRLPIFITNTSLALAIAGLALSLAAMVNLGRSMRFGLPTEKTEFKTGGLYCVSRNPMYVGFDILSLSGMIFTANIFVAMLGLYGMYTFHIIILAEEKFLEGRFGQKYIDYRRKVRRYI